RVTDHPHALLWARERWNQPQPSSHQGDLRPQDREKKGDRGLPVLGGSPRIFGGQGTGTRQGQRGERSPTETVTTIMELDATNPVAVFVTGRVISPELGQA
ncbi:unnamed protein product, partial [Ascophyllum nodosum]